MDLRIYSTLDDDLQTALRMRIGLPSRSIGQRRTLALAGAQQPADSSSSGLARLVALLAVVGGAIAAASFGVVLARCRQAQARRLSEPPT